MTGRPNPGRRAELLEQILSYLETHALSSISMRKLAQALGVSTFTLTYQFNNQEELMEAIAAAASQKLLALSESFEANPDSIFAYTENIRKFWRLARSKKYSAYLQIEIESSMLRAHGVGVQIPRRNAWDLWRRRCANAMISLGVPPSVAAAEAEVNQATILGLLYSAISVPDGDLSGAFEYALNAHIERIAELTGATPRLRAMSTMLGNAGD